MCGYGKTTLKASDYVGFKESHYVLLVNIGKERLGGEVVNDGGKWKTTKYMVLLRRQLERESWVTRRQNTGKEESE